MVGEDQKIMESELELEGWNPGQNFFSLASRRLVLFEA